jgi:hypothetical protein
MAIARTVFLALLLAFGVAPLAEAQSSQPLFIAADMVRAPGGSGPGCVLSNRFMRKEEVAWRIRVQDTTGKELDDKGLKGVRRRIVRRAKISGTLRRTPAEGADSLYLVDRMGDSRRLSDGKFQL